MLFLMVITLSLCQVMMMCIVQGYYNGHAKQNSHPKPRVTVFAQWAMSNYNLDCDGGHYSKNLAKNIYFKKSVFNAIALPHQNNKFCMVSAQINSAVHYKKVAGRILRTRDGNAHR